MDRLLRGRGWVMLIGALLAGIVFLNVSVLELNRGIAATTSRAAQLEAQNSVLRSRLANVASADAIQRAAEAHGFVLPQPGDIGYLRPRPDDARTAARRLASASALQAVGGAAPPAPVAAVPAQAAPATSVSAQVAPTTAAAGQVAPTTAAAAGQVTPTSAAAAAQAAPTQTAATGTAASGR